MLSTIMFIILGAHLDLGAWYWILCGIYGITKTVKFVVDALDI